MKKNGFKKWINKVILNLESWIPAHFELKRRKACYNDIAALSPAIENCNRAKHYRLLLYTVVVLADVVILQSNLLDWDVSQSGARYRGEEASEHLAQGRLTGLCCGRWVSNPKPSVWGWNLSNLYAFLPQSLLSCTPAVRGCERCHNYYYRVGKIWIIYRYHDRTLDIILDIRYLSIVIRHISFLSYAFFFCVIFRTHQTVLAVICILHKMSKNTFDFIFICQVFNSHRGIQK